MAVLEGFGQNLPSPCVCYPKDPMWNKVSGAKFYFFSCSKHIRIGLFSLNARQNLRINLFAKFQPG